MPPKTVSNDFFTNSDYLFPDALHELQPSTKSGKYLRAINGTNQRAIWDYRQTGGDEKGNGPYDLDKIVRYIVLNGTQDQRNNMLNYVQNRHRPGVIPLNQVQQRALARNQEMMGARRRAQGSMQLGSEQHPLDVDSYEGVWDMQKPLDAKPVAGKSKATPILLDDDDVPPRVGLKFSTPPPGSRYAKAFNVDEDDDDDETVIDDDDDVAINDDDTLDYEGSPENGHENYLNVADNNPPDTNNNKVPPPSRASPAAYGANGRKAPSQKQEQIQNDDESDDDVEQMLVGARNKLKEYPKPQWQNPTKKVFGISPYNNTYYEIVELVDNLLNDLENMQNGNGSSEDPQDVLMILSVYQHELKEKLTNYVQFLETWLKHSSVSGQHAESMHKAMKFYNAVAQNDLKTDHKIQDAYENLEDNEDDDDIDGSYETIYHGLFAILKELAKFLHKPKQTAFSGEFLT